MAGIGFELKKIYGRQTLASKIYGTLYATMATVGPIIIMIITLLILQFLMSLEGVSELELRFFISSSTYAFMIALLISSLLTTTISRYIADCIFLMEENKICSAMYGSLALVSIISGAVMLVLCRMLKIYFPDVTDAFLISYYLLGVATTNAYILMTFASALNEYKQITFGFVGGMVLSIVVYLVLKNAFNHSIALSACIALAVCFLAIVFVLVYQCTKAFYAGSDASFEFIAYFKKYPGLALSSVCYTMGIYFPMLIYWFFSATREHIGFFYTMPTYDFAFFFAFLINTPSMVIFVVKVETSFYTAFQSYVSALNTGSYSLIERERVKMSRVLKRQLFFVYEIQFVLTVIFICLFSVYLPYLNFSPSVINLFILESLGVYAVYCMYFTIIVLYYIVDSKSALLSSFVFFSVTVICTILALYIKVYALPLVIGGGTGWLTAFLLLRNRLNNLNAYLMC